MIPASKELRVKASFQCELTLASSVLYSMVSGLHTRFPGRHWGSQVPECTGYGETPGQESMMEGPGGCAGEWRQPCKASQTLCSLLLPVQTQILTKASLFGGFSLRKFTVKIAQEGT